MLGRLADDLQLYESIPLDSLGATGAELQSSADESLWVALLLRATDPPEASKDAARRALAGKTLSLGVAPVIEDPRAELAPGTRPRSEGETHLDFQLPLVPPGGVLPTDPQERIPRYQSLPSSSTTNVLIAPGIVQVTLPASHDEIGLWSNVEPLEAGIGEFPPTLADTKLEDRLLTWLRVKAASGAQARLLWVGINATTTAMMWTAVTIS